MIFFGKINILEYGIIGMIESRCFGFCCNLWNIDYIIGGFFGGVVGVVVFGIVLMVYGGDGFGFICILVVCCGFVGLKFICGCVFVGFY